MDELDVIGVYLGYLGLEAIGNFVEDVLLQIIKILILISPIFIWLHLKGIRKAAENRNSQLDKINDSLQDIFTALDDLSSKE